MSSVQERLQIKREPLDKWSVREQLCLASAVARSGDQNWMSVSRALKPFGDPNRPSDWFHQKNCAAQYGSLLENVETPKRKKRNSASDSVETPTESILRKLTRERLAELDKLLADEKAEYKKLQEDMILLQSGNVSEEQLDQWCKEIDEEEKQREEEAQAHNKWLKERERRKQEIERVWRPFPKGLSLLGQKRKAIESVDSLMELEQHEDFHQQQLSLQTQQQHPQDPTKPGLSPLLTSLLKSPSHSQSVATSSILHSAITNHRGISSTSSPTIASLLNSSTCVSVSPGIQQLVSTAIGQTTTDSNLIPTNATSLPEATAVDILEDAVDTLPNLKVEDIESTILSGDEPLPEIKNEEVEVIISDLMQNADIVENPEQHLQLDDNEDIITNLENELQELCEKEKMAEAEAAAAAAAAAVAAAVSAAMPVTASAETVDSSGTAFTTVSNLPLEKDVSENSVESNVTMDISGVPPAEAKLEDIDNANEQLKEEILDKDEKEPEKDKEPVRIDPFEFSEDIEISESLKPASSFSKHQELKQLEVREEEKNEEHELTDTSTSESLVQQETKEINKKILDEKLTKEKPELQPGSVEIVEVVELVDESINKELNKKQIEDIVHSHKPFKEEPTTTKDSESQQKQDEDSELITTEMTKIKNETFSEDEENDFEVELQTSDSEKIKKDNELPKSPLLEPKREETFTPDYSGSFFDDFEVNKLDKCGKAKRDYSRTKKKEEKDFDILLAVEKAVNAHLEENEQTEDTSSENNYYENDKKSDTKFKVRNENERSSSPWTEEEDLSSLKSKRRSSAPPTPIDSIPNSPASSFAVYDDDKDFKNWKKSVMQVYNLLATHKNASIFWKPITDDQAPGYHSLVFRPMDLQTIRKNIENGVIRTTSEFYRDVLLMFTNAIMFNKTNGTIYSMAKDMQIESLEPIQILMQAQQGLIPPKRETRTSESGSKRKRPLEENVRNKKRKDD